MDEGKFIELLGQGGLSIIIFVVWVITFTKINATLNEAFQKHQQLSSKLLQLLENEQDYKGQLISVLTRLELELKTNQRCPLTGSRERTRNE